MRKKSKGKGGMTQVDLHLLAGCSRMPAITSSIAVAPLTASLPQSYGDRPDGIGGRAANPTGITSPFANGKEVFD